MPWINKLYLVCTPPPRTQLDSQQQRCFCWQPPLVKCRSPWESKHCHWGTHSKKEAQWKYNQCSVVQCSTVQYSVVKCFAVNLCTVKCAVLRGSVWKCNAVNWSTFNYSTLKYSTVKGCTVKGSAAQCTRQLCWGVREWQWKCNLIKATNWVHREAGSKRNRRLLAVNSQT